MWKLFSVLSIVLPMFVAGQDCDVSFNISPISCAGATDGTVTVVPGSGGPFEYSFNGNAPTSDPVFPNVGEGFFSVFVVGTDPLAPCFAQLDTVILAPGLLIIGNPQYCPSNPPQLQAVPVIGYQPLFYAWSTLDSTSSISLPNGFEGNVSVNSVDANGCVSMVDVEVVELPSPVVEMSIPDTACEMTLVPLTTLSTNADTVVWRWQTTGVGFNFNQRAVFTDSGYQPVSLQGFDFFGCGSLPVQDSIYIEAQTPAIFTANQIPCSTEVEFILNSNTDSCALFIGDSLYFNQCSGYIRWDAERYTERVFTLYATQPNMCDDTLEITVDVRTEPTLFLSNAFSPDGDLINDLWPVHVDIPEAGYQVEIYDRWGHNVWTTTDPTEQWDGTFNGGALPIGVYPYTMKHRDPCEPTTEVSRRGHVTVIR